jgi:amino acid adenylation domain-containing protein
MIAIILTAGNGERLREVKACRSKCMLPMNGGVPLLKHKFELCKQCHGVEKIYVVIHDSETEIQEYFGNLYVGIPIVYISQSPYNKGIIGAIYSIDNKNDLYNKNILLMLGDEYFENIDMKLFIEKFNHYKDCVSAVVIPTSDPEKIKKNYSIDITSDKEILNAVEKPEKPFNNLIGTGTMAIPKTLLKDFYEKVYVKAVKELQLVDIFRFASRQGRKSYCIVCETKYRNVNKAEDLYYLNHSDRQLHDFCNIVEAFDSCVQRNKNETAVICDNNSITYKELDELSDIVCENLIFGGCKPGSCIALLCSRTIGHIVSFLAVLKAGCYYLPLDEYLPLERLSYMIEKSQAAYTIVTGALSNNLPLNLPILLYEDLVISKSTGRNRQKYINWNPISKYAYIMFTSGSTGKPKGAVIKQQSVLNLTYAIKNEVFDRFNKDALDVGVMASFSFDLSVQQIFPALLLGHRLYIIPKEIKTRPALLIYHLNMLDVCDGTPLIMDMLNHYLNNNPDTKLRLKHYLSAGEELKKETIHTYFKNCPDAFVTNCYGPTECTVETALFFLDKEIESKHPVIPVGKPIQNTQVYILDNNKRMVSPGITGEIWISGMGVGSGYINDDTLTNGAFMEDILNPAQKMYRTGDQGFWGKDSNLYYKGRIDNQIKYKGYRIETGEIEKTMESFYDIRSCRVFLMEDARSNTVSDKKLIAYFIPRINHIELNPLIEYLEKKLPDYMIPQAFVPVNTFALNNNGKIDKSLLPDYKLHSLKTNDEARRNSNKIIKDQDFHKLCENAERILHMPVLYNQSLISLGFDSLMSFALLADIEKIFQIRIDNSEWNLRLSLNDIYHIVKQKQATIAEKNNDGHNGLLKHPKNNPIMNALPMQKYLIGLEQINKVEGLFQLFNQMVYFIPIAIRIDILRLNDAFIKVQKKHDAFHMNFQAVGNHIRINLSEMQLQQIKVCENSCVSDAFHTVQTGADINDDTIHSIIADFDMLSWDSPPLIKMLYYRGASNNLIALAIHHAIFDYLSLMYFMEDLETFYNSPDIPLENVSRLKYFGEYIKKQNQYYLSDVILRESHFWQNILIHIELPDWKAATLKMPCLYKYKHLFLKDEPLYFADNLNFYHCCYKIGNDFCEKLRNFCMNNEVGEFTVLFTLLIKILHKYGDVRNPALLFFTSGRSRLAPIDTIGYFSYLICFTSGILDFSKDFYDLIGEAEYYLNILRMNENGFLDGSSKNIKDKVLSGSAIFDYQKLYNYKKSSLWNYIYPFECVGVYNPFSFRIFDYGNYIEISLLYNRNNLSSENITVLIEYYLEEWKQNIILEKNTLKEGKLVDFNISN